MSYKILIVDDEPANRRILERLFRAEYAVVTAASGGEALELLARHDIALIVSDQRMPVMTGIDFLKKAAEMRPYTVRIILTGYTDVNALVEAINSGVVYKYVPKPWVNEDLQQTVRRALSHYETIRAQHRLAQRNERLETRLKTTVESFVKIMTRFLEAKDPNVGGHLRRTSEHAVAVGQCFKLDREQLQRLSTAALIHEWAHVDIPHEIIDKNGDLTEAERREFAESFEGELDRLASVPDLEDAVSLVRSLYERFDGSGFPRRLAGEQIPLPARILAVADAFDRLTFPRDSNETLTQRETAARLESLAGKNFDPEIVKIICRLPAAQSSAV